MTKSKGLGFLSSMSSLNRPSGKHRRWGWGPDELGDLPGSIVSVYLYTPAVLQIRDVYPGSYFFHSRSRVRIFSIPDPGSASKNWSILTQKLVSKLSEIWSGLFRIGIRDPNPDFYLSQIPDPWVKKAPDPGSGSATLFTGTPSRWVGPRLWWHWSPGGLTRFYLPGMPSRWGPWLWWVLCPDHVNSLHGYLTASPDQSGSGVSQQNMFCTYKWSYIFISVVEP